MFSPAVFNPVSRPLTCLLLLFQRQGHAVLFSPLKRSEAARLEPRLPSDPRWSSKCGWMESCGSSAACPRRRPARTWSLLWPRPSVRVSNSLFSALCLWLKTHLNPKGFLLEKVWLIAFQPEIELLIRHFLFLYGLSGAFGGWEWTLCPRVSKYCSSHSLEQHIPTFSPLLLSP